MARRKSKGKPGIGQILFALATPLCIVLILSGLWRSVLFLLAGLALIAGAVFLLILLIRRWIRHRQTLPPLPTPSPSDVTGTSPQSEDFLVTLAAIAGQEDSCDACRHISDIPRVQPTHSDAASQNLQTAPKGFTPELLRNLEWKRFENLVEGYFTAIGIKTRPNRVGADGGVDIHLFGLGTSDVAAVVQCKSWHVYDVGVKPVRELLGVMAADNIQEGFFVTTGEYTSEARSWAAGKRITLIDGSDLLKLLADLPPEKQSELFVAVTAGDYTTPTCPRCGRKMVLRHNRKHPSDDSTFWGCPSYPRCRQTFRLKKCP